MKRILTIAGSDSSGGAGIQADLKTIIALGGYGMSALTALTAQNTQTISAIEACSASFVTAQIESVASDIGVDAVKTGMLFNHAIIEAVSHQLKKLDNIPIIIDPVMVATSGAILLEEDARQALTETLIPLATLLTPNIPEAELLSGIEINNKESCAKAAKHLLDLGAKSVLIKGGHRDGDLISDLLYMYDGSHHQFDHPRLNTKHTHGTGCTLSVHSQAVLSY